MHIHRIMIITAVLLLALVGCNTAVAPTEPSTPADTPMPTAEPTAPPTGQPQQPERLIEMAKADLAQQLGIEADTIEVMSVEEHEFSDASLGVPESGQSYIQVITPGYVIVLQAEGQTVTYHAAENRVVRVPDEQQGGGGAMIPVQIYLVALEDAGQSGEEIGCGDSLVPVEQRVQSSDDPPLAAAVSALLAVDEEFYGQSGLYNALHQSNLQVESVMIDADGTATVNLTGELSLGGVCDNPRVQGQLEATAVQFENVQSVQILVNGTPLNELLQGNG